MEILTGKVVEKAEEKPLGEVKKIELFTNPVAVNRVKLSFGAVPVMQTVLAILCGGALWYLKNNGGEFQTAAEEIIRRISGG